MGVSDDCVTPKTAENKRKGKGKKRVIPVEVESEEESEEEEDPILERLARTQKRKEKKVMLGE